MKVIKVGERGDGIIYQRPGSRFWWCAYMLHGVQERESTHEAEENKAKKYLRDRLKQVHADEIGARKFVGPSAEKVTVNELLDDLEANYTIREKFRPQVRSRFKFMRAGIGKLQAKSLSEREIDKWIERLKNTCNRLHHIPEEKRPLHQCNEKCKKLAPATVNQYTQLLGQARTHGRRKIGEVPKITKLKVENTRQGFFEYGEFLDALQFLPEEFRDYTHWSKRLHALREKRLVSGNLPHLWRRLAGEGGAFSGEKGGAIAFVGGFDSGGCEAIYSGWLHRRAIEKWVESAFRTAVSHSINIRSSS